MSLTGVLSIATSGLRATQSAITTTSNNIANADVAGYTRKTTVTTAVVSSGIGAGVEVSDIQAAVDEALERQVNGAAGKSAKANVISDYLTRLVDALGSTSGDDSLADALDDLFSALETLAVSPDDESAANSVIGSLETAVNAINDTSSAIQSLREETDSAIGDAVSDLNASLRRLDELNEQAVHAAALGQSTADIRDQQMQEVGNISGLIDASYFFDSEGRVQVYGPGGVQLLGSEAATVSFSTASSIDSGIVYDGSGSGLSGLTVNGKDITSSIDTGKIGGLLELRDEILVDRQAELDNLATTLADALNEAHNAGTALPPPNALTGTASVAAGDALSATGTLRVAVLDSSGTVQSVADIDLSAYATVGDLAAALDAVSGVSASIDSDGHLVVAAEDSSLGVGLTQLSGGVGASQEGVSSYFGLNDLLVFDEGGNLEIRGDILDDSAKLARGSLTNAASVAAGDAGISAGDATIISALSSALTEDQSFAAAGGLGSRSRSLTEYAADFISLAALTASNAGDDADLQSQVLDDLSTSLANKSGVNIDEETAELSVLETSYQANARVIAIVQELFDALLQMV
ncbi:MAG TPA: flagellar hook-associated protein FlgK [Dongiaceae bacterium]|jgi:flagellar hook-associated protein 1 FlgK|nr:flagellar hook-associated protein FlgK [Dongiaceae bacterium]